MSFERLWIPVEPQSPSKVFPLRTKCAFPQRATGLHGAPVSTSRGFCGILFPGMAAVNTQRLMVCRLDMQRLALPVAEVERVFAAMATLPAEDAPAGVCGIATVHGDTVPV